MTEELANILIALIGIAIIGLVWWFCVTEMKSFNIRAAKLEEDLKKFDKEIDGFIERLEKGSK